MEKFNKCDIFLIPTKEKTNIILDRNKLEYIDNAQIASTINSIVKGYNILIASDDKIKENDWCINLHNTHIFQATYTDVNSIYAKNASCKYEYSYKVKKIIATTDILLLQKYVIVDSISSGFTYKIPKIPKIFIDYFINEYNNNNIINKVFVQYNEIYSTFGSSKKELDNNLSKKNVLHTNNNTINIKLSCMKTHNLKNNLLNTIAFLKTEINSNYGFTQRTTEELELLYKTRSKYKNKLKELYDSEYYKGQLDLIEFMKDRFTEDAPLSYILSELKKEI